jgi:hypothetical protein
MNQQSESINELASALAKAQSEIGSVKKDAANPYFRSVYSTLANVWETVKPALTKQGLSVVQMPGSDERGYYVQTQLMHSSGQWIRSTTYMKPAKEDPQGIGSLISYARRYALQAMVMACPDDDDGEAAMGRHTAPVAKATVTKVVKPAPTKWYAEIESIIGDHGISATQYLQSKCEISQLESWTDLNDGTYRANLLRNPEKFLAAVTKWKEEK